MTPDDHLERHLELCKKVYERMKRDGSWPWPESPNSEDVLESNNPKIDV